VEEALELIGKRVRIRYAKFGRVNFVGEGVVVWVDKHNIRVHMPDGRYYWLPYPRHKGDRIEVFKDGEWKVWKEIPAKKTLRIAKGAEILLPDDSDSMMRFALCERCNRAFFTLSEKPKLCPYCGQSKIRVL